MRRFLILSALAIAVAVALVGLSGGSQADAQSDAQGGRYGSEETARAALDRARMQARRARLRGEDFETEMRRSIAAAEKARVRAAALAARVQQAEASIGIAEAELVLVNAQRLRLDRRLAQRREPIAEIAAALQNLVRRPLSLSLLRPGPLRETVYLGAVLDSTVPVVRVRTADLRAEIERTEELEAAARRALEDRRAAERQLSRRRAELVAMSEREGIIARRAAGAARREELRALALAEEARDIDALVGRLENAGELRTQLAALPGPILRPADPASARTVARPFPTPSSTAPPALYRLPVDGRIAAGFGEIQQAGGRAGGLAIVPRPGAQVVAPAAGRVSFAGPYRGYGRIVILEHANGWTSLLTGLADLDARVGQEVVAGSPLGRAGRSRPEIVLELRREGEPVNPLDYLTRSSSNGA